MASVTAGVYHSSHSSAHVDTAGGGAASSSSLAGLSSSLAYTLTQGTSTTASAMRMGSKTSDIRFSNDDDYVANTPFVDPGAHHAAEFSRLQRELDGIREKRRRQEEELRRRVREGPCHAQEAYVSPTRVCIS